MRHNDHPEPRCRGQWNLFESTHRRAHHDARRLCLGDDGTDPCPFIGGCRAIADGMRQSIYAGGLHGTWGGVLYGFTGQVRRDVE